MKKKDKPTEVNLLELIPSRLMEYETGDDGLVTIIAPRKVGRIMKALLGSRAKKKVTRWVLDDIGSAVWTLCDGERTVGRIGEIMKEDFGERIEPCFDRLALFFGQLEGARYMEYRNLEALKEKE
ncbi:MAG: PqqD family protein [Candidatus Krumholzibacteria bacterium]|nr:PqqD family protein [Candidatus Krumholzibacteria bacterium]